MKMDINDINLDIADAISLRAEAFSRRERGDIAGAEVAFQLGMQRFPEEVDVYGHPVFRKELIRILLGRQEWTRAEALIPTPGGPGGDYWHAILFARGYSESGDSLNATHWWNLVAEYLPGGADEAQLNLNPLKKKESSSNRIIIKTKNISDAPVCDINQIKNTRGISKAKIFSGNEKIEPKTGLWSTDHIFCMQRNEVTPDIFVFSAKDAVIFGPGLVVSKNEAFVSEDIYSQYIIGKIPSYCDNHLDYVDNDFKNLKEMRIDTPCFVIGQFSLGVYGHFLLEVVPKLFLINKLEEFGLFFPIVVDSTFPIWAVKIVREICPRHKIISYDALEHYITASRVFLPSWGAKNYVHHSEVRKEFQRLSKNINVETKIHERVFIGRRNSGSYRYMRNYEEIERIARQKGFHFLMPEHNSWRDQIGIFSGAKYIVGEYGSGLHNSVFSPSGTKILVINAINRWQSILATTFGHRIGFVMPKDKLARTYIDGSTDRQDYEVCPGEFEARLDLMLSSESEEASKMPNIAQYQVIVPDVPKTPLPVMDEIVDAESLLKEALKSLSKGDIKSAEAALRRGLKVSPHYLDHYGHPAFRKELIRMLLGQRDWERAAALIPTPGGLGGDHWHTILFARAYREAGEEATAAHWFEQVTLFLPEALGRKPLAGLSAPDLLKEAFRLAQNDASNAEKALRLGMEKFPDHFDQYGHPVFRKELIRTLLRKQDWHQATMLIPSPGGPGGDRWHAILFARAHRDTGNMELARSWWLQVLDSDPLHVEAAEAVGPEREFDLHAFRTYVDGFSWVSEKINYLPVFQPPPTESGLYLLSEANISDIGYLVHQDKLVLNPELCPPYWSHMIQTGKYPEAYFHSRKPKIVVEEPCISAVAYGWGHYGHFLVEALPRLLAALHAVRTHGLSAKILIPTDTPNWLLNIFDNHLGIQDSSWLFFDKKTHSVLLKKAIIPTYAFFGEQYHPKIDALLDGIRGIDWPSVPPWRHVFISRLSLDKKLRSGRPCQNEEELCQIASEEFGYEIVSPESLNWKQQVELFREARSVVGLAGSGLHTSLLAGEGLRIGSIGWINTVQEGIARLRRQRLRYLQPDLELREPFLVDLNLFRRFLAEEIR